MKATDAHALKSLLESLQDFYDFILVDTPPSESMLTASALTFANEVIIPLQAHYFAMEGLAQAMEQVEKVKQGLNPNIRVVGILGGRPATSVLSSPSKMRNTLICSN